jgi:hypothetical protein
MRSIGHRLAVVLVALLLVLGNAATVSADPVFPAPGEDMTDPPDAEGGLGEFRPVTPARILDTRTGAGGTLGKIGAASSIVLDVTGAGGVPASGVAAVALNVTVTGGTASSFLTLHPSGTTRPGASNLNFVANQTVPNFVTVKVGADGNVRVYNQAGSVHVIVDVAGWYAIAGTDPVLEQPTASKAVPGVATVGEPERRVEVSTPGDTGSVAPREQGTGASTSFEVQHVSPSIFTTDEAGYATSVDSAVGRLYSVNDAGAVTGTCSGTVVARNLVLTAAHCIYHHTIAGSFFDFDWKFVPGKFGTSQPVGLWDANSAAVLVDYQNNGYQSKDWAFVIFDVPNGSGQLLGDVTGMFQILYDSQGGPKYSMGYPSEGWFAANQSASCTTRGVFTGSDTCRPYYCSSRISDASTQYRKELNDTSVSFGGWWEVGFGCFMTGGSSGGPVFEYANGKWYVNGVNSHLNQGDAPTYTAGCTRPTGICFQWGRNMWSPYFNKVIADVFAQYAK